ncbi:Protein-lysine N-methyltransferase efm6 [Coemansia sp. S610]|uniref:Protein-lysine N-methyltransferase efm6 n=1 Tax=Coemansia linderi TaxID=2663919 RepID=A0ACC1KJ22_9FUNG|nr:Protein-lysine N-methyltransferase efm6 [Coemansia sp. RSA 2675]KAJ2011921.1 Protein-lysine N-methyltransferase efm6 [Coemansia sp. S610]KAJ2790334.1 Protein-lysine N-methyltransferase efm6 [Coemansia linderi]
MDFSRFIAYELELSRADAPLVRLLQDASGATGCGVGSTVWDTGLVLAKYLDHQTSLGNLDLSGKTVLELGSGTGIVGIALGRLHPQCQVILTDKKELIPLLSRNIELNSAMSNTRAQCLDWTLPTALDVVPDLIVVSDGIWDKDLHQPLAETLARLAGSETRVLLAYETRKFDEEAEFIAKWSQTFRFRDIKPSEQDPVMQSEDIFMFEGSRKIKAAD